MWIGLGKGNVLREIKIGEKKKRGVSPPRDRPFME